MSIYNFSLGSLPTAVAVQFGYLLRILITDFKKISYPFEEFNLPVKIILFLFFLLKILIGLIAGYKISQLFLLFSDIPLKNLFFTHSLTKKHNLYFQ